jgi:uncharacterized membrane protein YbhN (UPF0104 family)
MESRPPGDERAHVTAARPTRLLGNILKTALGLALLAALFVWGQIDLKALAQLADHRTAVAGCLVLLLMTLPLAALRWSILLRALGVSLSFVDVLHFVAMGALTNMFFFGTVGGDAVRGLYAWRAVGRTGDRVAVSVLVDRIISLLALLFLCLMFTLFNWGRMQQAPALVTLGASTIIAVIACMVGIAALFAAPRLVAAFEKFLARWPSVASLFRRGHDIVLMLRTNPTALLAALALAAIIQVLVVFVVALLSDALGIGVLGLADFMLAAPLTLAVNALPLTPGGIGVGEVAFDQICRWLEPVPTGAAYSSIFFAYRLISSLTGLPGLISLVTYRIPSRSGTD